MSSDEAQCAHLRIEYRTEQVEHDFGPRDDSRPTDLNDPNVPAYGVRRVTRGWWECAYGCGTRFTPVLPVSQPLASEGIPETVPGTKYIVVEDSLLAILRKRWSGPVNIRIAEQIGDQLVLIFRDDESWAQVEQLRADLAAARSLLREAQQERDLAQDQLREADDVIRELLQRPALPSSPTPATGEQD